MATAREIKERMKSIRDTRKITNAMYMISSTKLKKAKKSLADTEPYFYTLQYMIARIRRHLPAHTHSRYLHAPAKKPPGEKVHGLLVVTGDKGLAGSYHHNLLKLAAKTIADLDNAILFVVGELGRQYFLHKHIPVRQNFQYTVQDPTMARARHIADYLMELFLSGEVDDVSVIFTRMTGNIQSEAEQLQLLPVVNTPVKPPPLTDVHMEEFTMKPDGETVLNSIIPSYISGLIYGILVESFCSEQNARMLAMEAATSSADNMLRELSIAYNRVRQSAITQELTEVASGARAQKQARRGQK